MWHLFKNSRVEFKSSNGSMKCDTTLHQQCLIMEQSSTLWGGRLSQSCVFFFAFLVKCLSNGALLMTNNGEYHSLVIGQKKAACHGLHGVTWDLKYARKCTRSSLFFSRWHFCCFRPFISVWHRFYEWSCINSIYNQLIWQTKTYFFKPF